MWWHQRKAWRKAISRLTYQYDMAPAPRRRFNMNRRFAALRLTRLYFLTFQDHQFRKLFRNTAKMDGNFEINYLRFLEGRAFAIIYRLNFTPDVFWLLSFVKAGSNFFLEYKPISLLNMLIPVGKLITIRRKWHRTFAIQIFKRIKLQTLLFPTPKFIYSSYRFFFFYLLRYPKRTDLFYPFALDLQRITGYN